MNHQYDLVTIPVEKMTRGMLNEYTKSLYKNIKFWLEEVKNKNINLMNTESLLICLFSKFISRFR